MSFLPINEQNQMAPQGQTTNAPTSSGNTPSQSGGSAGAGAGGGAAKGSAVGTPSQFGSSASNLGAYLSANAPQIQGQANTVAGNLNTQYGQVGTDIGNAANQFGQSVSAGYAVPNQQAVQTGLNEAQAGNVNANDASAFQGQLNDTYTGPQNFESTTPYSNIQNEVSSAVQNASLLNSPSGLQNYFASTSGPNATQATNTLDALLLQGNPQAQQTVQTAANQFQNLTPQFQNSVTAADQGVTQAQQAAQQASQYAQGQFNPFVQNFGNQITNGAQQAEAQRQAYNTAQQQNYNTLTPIQQAIQAYQGTGLNITDPLGTYLNQTPITNAINSQNYSTPQQYAEAQALQQLSNNSLNLPINQSTVNLAGTAPTVGQVQNADPANLVQQTLQSVLAGNTQDQVFGNQGFSNWQNLLQQLQQYDPNQIVSTPGVGPGTPTVLNYSGPSVYHP